MTLQLLASLAVFLLVVGVAFVSADCSQKTVLTDRNGTIHDGEGNYVVKTICEWLIDAPNATIALTFSSYETECGYDFLFVFDGDSYDGRLLASLSGKTLPPPIRARSGKMLIVLYSDQNYVRDGFVAKYVVETCPFECSGRGKCVNGECECHDGYSGDGCEINQKPDNCSDHGIAHLSSDQKCVCEQSFIGVSCSFNESKASPTDDHHWFRLSNHSDVFTPRMAHAGAYYPQTDTIWVYGGYDLYSTFNDLLKYDVMKSSWTAVKAPGTYQPGPLHGHILTLWGDSLLLHGGETSVPGVLTNELWEFNLISLTWHLRVASNCSACPKPVAGHAACMVGDRMFVYGGYSSLKGFTSRLWAYDAKQRHWKKMTAGGTKSSLRQYVGHAMVYHNTSNRIIIFGGYTPNKLLLSSRRSSALLIYHLDTQFWTTKDPIKTASFGRTYHSGTLFGNYLLVYGGGWHQHHVQETCYSPYMHTYHLGCHQWKTESTGSASPGGRISHVAVKRDESTLLVVGGFSGLPLGDVLACKISKAIIDKPTSESEPTHCDTLTQTDCTKDPECFWCGNATGKCHHYLQVNVCRHAVHTEPCPDACLQAPNACGDCLAGKAWWPEGNPRTCGWCVQERRCFPVDKKQGRCSDDLSASGTYWWGSPTFVTSFGQCSVEDKPPGLTRICYKEPWDFSRPDSVAHDDLDGLLSVSPDSDILEEKGLKTRCLAKGFLRPLPIFASTDVSLPPSYTVKISTEFVNSAQFVLGNGRSEKSGVILRHLSGSSLALKPDNKPVLPILRVSVDNKANATIPAYYLELNGTVRNSLPLTGKLRIKANLDLSSFNGTHLSNSTALVTRDFLQPFLSGDCSQYSNCMSCLSDAGCGWCGHSESCIFRDNESSCPHSLTMTSDNCWVCSDYKDCKSCLKDGNCEWLDSGNHKLCGRRRGLPTAITNETHCQRPCEKMSSCDQCLGGSGCSWCVKSQLCFEMSSIQSRNAFGQCLITVGPYGAFHSCQKLNCSVAPDCDSCLAILHCGWCGPVLDPSKGRCISGDFQSSYGEESCAASGDRLAEERNLTSLGKWGWSYGRCPDMRECELDKHDCHVNASCENTLESYKCECNQGYKGDGKACERTCSRECVQGNCSEAPLYQCNCEVGWTGKICNESCGCHDHSFCSKGYGRCDQCLHNTHGNYCELCVPGSYGNATLSDVGCRRCQCNGHSNPDQGHCDLMTGDCYCVEGYRGAHCSKCSQGFYGNPLSGGKCYSECTGLTILPFRRSGALGSAKGEGVSLFGPSNCFWIITAANRDQIKAFALNSSSDIEALQEISRNQSAKIVLNVASEDLNTLCFSDHVHVFDGLPDFLVSSKGKARRWKKLAAYCGKQQETRPVVAWSGLMAIWYQGKGGGVVGFNASFEMRTCSRNCSTGDECLAQGNGESMCECVSGYVGPHCDIAECPSDCQGHRCNHRKGLCDCPPSLSGLGCETGNSSAVGSGSVDFFSRSFDPMTGAQLSRGNLTSFPGVMGHTVHYDATEDSLLVFGGYSLSNGFNSDILVKISLPLGTWEVVPVAGKTAPTGRSFHSTVVIGNIVILVGGMTANGTTDEVFIYSMMSKLWSSGRPCPVSLAGHTATLYKSDVVVVGGYSTTVGSFNDAVLVYSLSDSWQVYRPFGESPGGIFGHSALLYSPSDRLVIYGGYSSAEIRNTTFLRDIFILDKFSDGSVAFHWKKVEPTYWFNFLPVAFHSVYQDVDSMLLMGGSTAEGSSEPLQTIYNFDCNNWFRTSNGFGDTSRLAVMAAATVSVHSKGLAFVVGGFDGVSVGDVVSVQSSADFCLSATKTTNQLCSRIPGCAVCSGTNECVTAKHPGGCSVMPVENNCSSPFQQLRSSCDELTSCRSCIASGCDWCPCRGSCMEETDDCKCSAFDIVAHCPAMDSCGTSHDCRSCIRQNGCAWIENEFLEMSCVANGTVTPRDRNIDCRKSCREAIDCAECAEIDECVWSDGLEICLASVELPLTCSFGQCDRISRSPSDCRNSCAVNFHCRACIQQLGCGWCAKPDGSGNGTCIDGSVNTKCNLTGTEFGSWSYLKCPKEDECRNNHHTCRPDQECNNTDDSFECRCRNGYEEDQGNDRCIPSCRNDPCKYGLCVSPDVCQCDFGYVGAGCDVECKCNGVGQCFDDTKQGLLNCSQCRNHTQGPQCNRCEPFHVRHDVYSPKSFWCASCFFECHGNAHVCVSKKLSATVDDNLTTWDLMNISGEPVYSGDVKCVGCDGHSEGDKCEKCSSHYFNKEKIVRPDSNLVRCEPCFCNGHSDICDGRSGRKCNCQNNTVTPSCADNDATCYLRECTECGKGFAGNATGGFSCYETVRLGSIKEGTIEANGIRLLAISPEYTNVDLQLTIWILEGHADLFIGIDEHDIRVLNDPLTGDHSANFTVTTRHCFPVNDNSADLSPTVIRLSSNGRFVVPRLAGQLRIIVPYTSFAFESQKFFVALVGMERPFQSFVYFRQDSAEINLFIFFSVFFSGFFLFLACCVLVWKGKQGIDRRRQAQQEEIEIENRKRRPSETFTFLCEREIRVRKSKGRNNVNRIRAAGVAPAAVQCTVDDKARVETFLVQLPGSPFEAMKISLASALLLSPKRKELRCRTSNRFRETVF